MMPRNSMTKTGRAAFEALRGHALAYPEAEETNPWGHSAIKVKGKTFVFLYEEGGKVSLSCKLGSSREEALLLPFAEPTGYGLGKSGWVTGSFEADMGVPVDLFESWIDESYRAIAPKKLVSALDGGEATRSTVRKAGPKAGSRTATRRTSKPAVVDASSVAKAEPATTAKPAPGPEAKRPAAKTKPARTRR